MVQGCGSLNRSFAVPTSSCCSRSNSRQPQAQLAAGTRQGPPPPPPPPPPPVAPTDAWRRSGKPGLERRAQPRGPQSRGSRWRARAATEAILGRRPRAPGPGSPAPRPARPGPARPRPRRPRGFSEQKAAGVARAQRDSGCSAPADRSRVPRPASRVPGPRSRWPAPPPASLLPQHSRPL